MESGAEYETVWYNDFPNADLPGGRQTKRAEIALSARAHMLDNLDDVISIRSLSRALGVSERTLRYAFQDTFGTSPLQYLKALRLRRAQRALRRANPTRTTVRREALRSGFWHLSRFSAEYKGHFGELPSATLKADRSTPTMPKLDTREIALRPQYLDKPA